MGEADQATPKRHACRQAEVTQLPQWCGRQERAGQKRSLQAREEAEVKFVTESGEIREGDTHKESEGESGESRQEEEEAVEAEADMDTVRLATNINTQVTRAEKELEESRVAEAPATQTTTQWREGCWSLDIQAEADYGQRGKAERERERQESLSEELRRETGGVESAERESETLGEASKRPEDKGAGESAEGSFHESEGAKNSREWSLAQRVREEILYSRPIDYGGGSQPRVGSTYPPPNAIAEVVLETQLMIITRTKGNMCSAIMASIRLESPTPHRGGGEGIMGTTRLLRHIQ